MEEVWTIPWSRVSPVLVSVRSCVSRGQDATTSPGSTVSTRCLDTGQEPFYRTQQNPAISNTCIVCYVLQNLPVGLVCLSGLLNAESYRMILDTGTLAGSKIIPGPSNPAPPVSQDPGHVMMDLTQAAAPGSQSPPVETPLIISGTDWECSTMCTMLKMVDLCTT